MSNDTRIGPILTPNNAPAYGQMNPTAADPQWFRCQPALRVMLAVQPQEANL